MIGGFELPTGGRIELRGVDVTTAPPDKRPVNMVFQSYALFPHLNVQDNVAFGLRRHRVREPEVRDRVADALELVRLTGYGKRKPNELSGGQQQRVALARALVNRPNVLLLDEPLGALDLKLRKSLQLELKRIQVEVGITFVYVTHDQEEALTMSDRIAVMNHGRVEQIGLPEELYDRPATRFVADFMGTTNLLRGEVRSVDGGVAAVRLEGGDACRVAAVHGLATGEAIEISLRPETVSIGEAGRGGPGSIEGRVEQAAYMGATVQYQVRSQGGALISVLAPKSGRRFVTGDDVEVGWSPEDALVVDRSSDQRGGTG
jgi:spermidine/putrescine transport system ATP-binding protein